MPIGPSNRPSLASESRNGRDLRKWVTCPPNRWRSVFSYQRGTMDLSKLPKLSQTPQQAGETSPAMDSASPAAAGTEHCRACGLPLRAGARFCDGCGAVAPRAGERLGAGAGAAEVWISAIFGIVFILIGKTFGAYLWSLITHQPFHTGVNWTSGELAGTEVAYPQLQGFVIWTDSAM